MIDKFYELAKECHKDRIEQEQNQKTNLDYKAKIIYSNFCIWCRINYKNITEQSFREYLQQYNDIDFWIKKRIFETYFNYTFNYDNMNEKWICKKINAV